MPIYVLQAKAQGIPAMAVVQAKTERRARELCAMVYRYEPYGHWMDRELTGCSRLAMQHEDRIIMARQRGPSN